MKYLTLVVLILVPALASAQFAGGSPVPFTYQGELTTGGVPANGSYDFRFDLFSTASGGTGMGFELVDDVNVTDGVFAVPLDFVNNFATGTPFYLEISVREAGGGAYSLLSPRQQITPAPLSYSAFAVVDDAIDSFSIDDGSVRAEDVDVGDIQLRVTQSCPSGSAIRLINTNGSVVCESAGGTSDAWSRSGNAGTSQGNDFIGTTDDVALDVRVNNNRAMRFEWGFNAAGSPNVTGGHAANSIPDTEEASVIAGGGLIAAPNSITSSYSFIGGGIANQVNANYGSILGGSNNLVNGNDGIAMGRGAQALHNNTFVFNDGGTFASTGPDQFLIEASGGVGIGLNNPSDFVHISAPAGADAFRIQLGGTTRLRVHDNGGVSVGVNSGPPAGGLLVQGEIRTSTPVTRWKVFSPHSFLPYTEDQPFNKFEEFLNITGNASVAGDGEFYAPVELPQGANVTELRARVVDNQASGNLSVQLIRFGVNDDSSDPVQLMANVGTNGDTSGIQSLTDTSISFNPINNQSYWYALRVNTTNSDQPGLHAVFNARLAYTTDSVVD